MPMGVENVALPPLRMLRRRLVWLRRCTSDQHCQPPSLAHEPMRHLHPRHQPHLAVALLSLLLFPMEVVAD